MLFNQMDQIMDEATHFPRDNIETCLDLILTDQPNLFVHSGVIQSPDPNCKHQIINGKINFSIPCPPPYKLKLGVTVAPTSKELKIILNPSTGTSFLQGSQLMKWYPALIKPS